MSKKDSNPIPCGVVKPSPPSSLPPKRYNIESYMSNTTIVQVYDSGVYIGDCLIDRGEYGPFIDISRAIDPRKAA